jgi:hypothetical protein
MTCRFGVAAFMVILSSPAFGTEIRTSVESFPSSNLSPIPQAKFTVTDQNGLDLRVQANVGSIAITDPSYLWTTMTIDIESRPSEFRFNPLTLGLRFNEPRDYDIPILLIKPDSGLDAVNQLVHDSQSNNPSDDRLLRIHQRARVIFHTRLSGIESTRRPAHANDVIVAFIYLQTAARLFARLYMEPDKFTKGAADWLENENSANASFVSNSIGGSPDVLGLIRNIRLLATQRYQQLFQAVRSSSSPVDKEWACARYRKLQSQVESDANLDIGIERDTIVGHIKSAVAGCQFQEAIRLRGINNEAAAQTVKAQIKALDGYISTTKDIKPSEAIKRKFELENYLQQALPGF